MSWQAYCFRRDVPVAAPGWIYQSRAFDTEAEARARAELAMTERYGESTYRWLLYQNHLSIKVVELPPPG